MDILERLSSLADLDYRAFTRRTTQTELEILGVRAPHLRKIAGELAREDFRAFLDGAPDGTLEVLLLKAALIGRAEMELSERFLRVRAFVPLVDNWAVCDTLMSAIAIKPEQAAEYADFLEPYFRDNREFFARFGAIMMMHYANDEWIDFALGTLAEIRQPDYYARMGVAWAVSDLYTAYPEKAQALLQSGKLENWTHNKSIQKIVESRRVSPEAKDALRVLKRTKRRIPAG